MTQFSERLKLILDESGTNVYQLSKNANLDRTTIQRALKGERLPGISFVEKMFDYLRVSPLQRSELLELYTISRVGEKVYAGRIYIKEMLERMAAVHTKHDDIPLGQRTVSIEGSIGSGIKAFSGQYSVQNLIRDILEDEAFNEDSPHIYLTVPFEHTFLFDLLYHLFSACNSPDGKKKLLVKHIIQLSKNPHNLQDSNYNLKVLSNVLPFAFCEWGGYEPYYYYGNVDASKAVDIVLPYYILTSRYLIQLSEDFTTAVLCSNNEIFKIYCDNFEKCLLQTRALIKNLSICEEMLGAYFTACKDSGQYTHVIEPQPCFASYYTDQLIEDKLRRNLEGREIIKPLVTQLYDTWRTLDKRPMSFFSAEGIEYFAKTGVLADLPPQYVVPFTVEERKMLLEQLKNDIAHDTYFARASNSSKFIISPLASLVLYGTNVIMISTINSSGTMSASFIGEKSICEAFFDFFESLPESNLLCSKEETIKIIAEAIAAL